MGVKGEQKEKKKQDRQEGERKNQEGEGTGKGKNDGGQSDVMGKAERIFRILFDLRRGKVDPGAPVTHAWPLTETGRKASLWA